MCGCIYVCVHVCGGAHAYVYTHIWKSGVDIKGTILSHFFSVLKLSLAESVVRQFATQVGQ